MRQRAKYISFLFLTALVSFSLFGHSMLMASRIDMGLFVTDSHKDFPDRAKELLSRFTWQRKQTFIGYMSAGIHNLLGGVRSVSYYGGATVVESYADRFGAITLGNYIIGQKGIKATPGNSLFQHEYGHYLQSQDAGPTYFARYGIPSILSDHEHRYHPAEQDANIRALNYFLKYESGFDSVDSNGKYSGRWKKEYHPIDGFDWNHFGSANNYEILQNRMKPSALEYVIWFMFPATGDIHMGIIRAISDNDSY